MAELETRVHLLVIREGTQRAPPAVIGESCQDFEDYGDVVIPHIQHQEPLRVQCGHFLECIAEGKQPLTDGYSGARVVQILEAAEQSLENHGRTMSISPNGPVPVGIDTQLELAHA